jgi:DNA uptake protein ComE-like DNA-binding protein
LLERLTFFYDHPLNLNTASRKDLEDLEMLTPFQIASIMSYREEVGKNDEHI